MRIVFHRKYSWLLFLLLLCVASAHEVPVHEAITRHAAASALSHSLGYGEFMNMILPEMPTARAVDSIVDGSRFEDNVDVKEDGINEGGIRPYNHFYDPLTSLGLSSIPPEDRRIDPFGRNSLIWASVRNSPGVDFPGFLGFIAGNVGKYNKWAWQNARDYEWDALTQPYRTDRQVALAKMFRAVGQVVHLLEDTSQPQHVRNEHHVFVKGIDIWHSPIEIYGESNVTTLNYEEKLLDWRNAGFTKLEDFWNRHLYNGNGARLTADANGGDKLGLAEFSNGNFVGDRHLYAEYFKPGSVEYYPFPSRDHSTNYKQVKAEPTIGIDTFKLKNGNQVNGIYLEKNADGITIKHHTRMNYLGGKGFYYATIAASSFTSSTALSTIRDENVLGDYHDKLIPKAVEYSAGLLDYFFRGKLEVTMCPNGSSYTLTIKNISGQDLKGGGFRLFWDNPDGDRTELTDSTVNGDFQVTWDPVSDRLDDNATLTATFTPPTGVTVAKYTLVYKGTIGTKDGNHDPQDQVDAGIAIAVTTLEDKPLWWSMEQTSGDRFDSTSGYRLQISGFGTVNAPSSKAGLGRCIELISSGWDQITIGGADCGRLLQAGGAVTMVGWFKVDTFSPTKSLSLGLVRAGVNSTADFGVTVDNGSPVLFASGQPNTSISLSGNSWTFFILQLDSAGTLAIEFNRSTVFSTSCTPLLDTVYVPVAASVSFDAFDQGTSLSLDELGIFDHQLTTAQKDYLWNAGAGRTWPITLP